MHCCWLPLPLCISWLYAYTCHPVYVFWRPNIVVACCYVCGYDVRYPCLLYGMFTWVVLLPFRLVTFLAFLCMLCSHRFSLLFIFSHYFICPWHVDMCLESWFTSFHLLYDMLTLICLYDLLIVLCWWLHPSMIVLSYVSELCTSHDSPTTLRLSLSMSMMILLLYANFCIVRCAPWSHDWLYFHVCMIGYIEHARYHDSCRILWLLIVRCLTCYSKLRMLQIDDFIRDSMLPSNHVRVST